MTARITPTRGRVLYFRPARSSLKASDYVRMHTLENGRPQFVAIIVDVHEYDGRINIAWFDHAGVQRAWGPLPIWQEGDPPMDAEVSYCEWMPYQKGQAAKADADGADLVQLRRALEESLKLQSHYATLLNAHDGGHRLGFTVDEWLARIGRP